MFQSIIAAQAPWLPIKERKEFETQKKQEKLSGERLKNTLLICHLDV